MLLSDFLHIKRCLIESLKTILPTQPLRKIYRLILAEAPFSRFPLLKGQCHQNRMAESGVVLKVLVST
jgi:hypothetical protein